MDGQNQGPNTPGGGWQYNPESSNGDSLTPGYDPQLQSVTTQRPNGEARTVSWSASEYIAHEKSAGWYMALVAITIGVVGVVFVISHDIITLVAIILVALIFGFAAGRKPRQLNYQVDDHGLTISSRLLPYATFRAFAIVEEGPFASLIFLPLKRFAPITSVYLDPNDEHAVVSIVADNLPLENHEPDAIERLLHRIRF